MPKLQWSDVNGKSSRTRSLLIRACDSRGSRPGRGFAADERAVPDRLQAGSSARSGAAVATVSAWHERARQRRALMALSDPMLRDIGISRAKAQRESARPFWRV
jgi:uncharacterized protein YjiS (DUF1127 family)